MRRRLFQVVALFLLITAAVLAFRRWFPTDMFQVNREPYRAAFTEADGWSVGEDANAAAERVDERFEITVKAPVDLFLSTNGQIFDNGVYEVTATQLEGPLDNGYGLVLRADTESNQFILFEVSGDGFVWIGRCNGICDSAGWRESAAVKRGLNAPNRLRVEADGEQLRFVLNGEEIRTLQESTPPRGEVGVMVETFGQPGVRVAFEDLTVTPLGTEAE